MWLLIKIYSEYWWIFRGVLDTEDEQNLPLNEQENFEETEINDTAGLSPVYVYNFFIIR